MVYGSKDGLSLNKPGTKSFPLGKEKKKKEDREKYRGKNS